MASTRKLSTYRRKRDFKKTTEPSGAEHGAKRGSGLHFVVQKHAASHVHYDLRLEMDGVMKSWAVPKGPSLDPSIKRLAIEVEDHPIAYNSFEGTIPEGEYGGGTVMIWDEGRYSADEVAPADSERALLAGHRAGKISFTLKGKRLAGSFALVRTDSEDDKPKWLLIKHKDEHAEEGSSITDEEATSVASGRTMDEIAEGEGGRRVWHSNRAAGRKNEVRSPHIEPMLARSASAVPTKGSWTYELKYDGIRVLAFIAGDAIALVTRNGNDKAMQFPEVVEDLGKLASAADRPLVLDGEIVGIRDKKIARFESLQGRMHLTDRSGITRLAETEPAVFVGFDVLVDGDDNLAQQPWRERRQRLEDLHEEAPNALTVADSSPDYEKMRDRAVSGGWEGLIAKRTDSAYHAGKRSNDWLKLKIDNQQEFVIGGWTEPRGSRLHMGALLLGYYASDGKLIYAGHTGTGFSRDTLADLAARLEKIERKTSPFSTTPATNQPAHWVTPKLVAEIKFNEWTKDGKLRQPVFLGLREDKDAREVVREGAPVQELAAKKEKKVKSEKVSKAAKRPSGSAASPAGTEVVKRIRALSDQNGGPLAISSKSSIEITNLDKVFFPREKYTKQDLLVYYAGMAEYVLPCMQDRPLVLKRYPNGIKGEAFFQQNAPENVPAGVRVESVSEEGKSQPRFIGGDLTTLLYSIQMGAISYDPWHSRMGHLDAADYTILDLDPGAGTTFKHVVRVASLLKDELDELGMHGGLKTSGSSGIHVYLPLPEDTPLDAATLIAQIIATRVARRHPKLATVERMRRKRPRGTVYVDYLQNILGKSVAGAYAVRAKPGATVSTPLAWEELADDLDMRVFTIESVPRRMKKRGDLWAEAMREPNNLDVLTTAAETLAEPKHA